MVWVLDYLNFMYSETIQHNFEAFRVWVGKSLYIFVTKAEDVEVNVLQ